MRPRVRLADESGIAVPIAILVMLIVSLLVGVAVAYSVRTVQKSNRDRYSARALAAADAGLDMAGYRMNALLVGGILSDLTSTTNNQLLSLGCVNLNATGGGSGGSGTGGVSIGTSGYCAPPLGNTWENVDSEGGASAGEQFQYYSQLAVNLDLSNLASPQALNPTGQTFLVGGRFLQRRVVSIGKANGEQARVLGLFQVDLPSILNGTNPALRLFTLKRYVQCPISGGTSTDPAAGCPSV